MNDVQIWTIIGGFLGMQGLTLLVNASNVRALRSEMVAMEARVMARIDVVIARLDGLDERVKRLEDGRGLIRS